MDIKFLIIKYENQIKELQEYKKRLQNEYSKNTSEETKKTFFQVVVKINTLQEVLIDLKNI